MAYVRRLVPAITAAVTLALLPGAAGAAERTEEPVPSAAPDAAQVKVSYVRHYAPLPESAGPRPEACDWIGFLRYRNASGPSNASQADAVITLMPGILAGSSSMELVARNAVRMAAERGANVEVWTIDRRSNCLEDHFGTQAAFRARDVTPAFDYYYRGKEVQGRKFAGFVPPSEAGFMKEFGLARTTRDWHTIITRELPDQRVRAAKLVCGGHSLGGSLTAAFASWDFDGNPETTEDAGYNQCAAFAGLDTSIAIDGSSGGPAGVGVLSSVAAQSGGSPYLNAPPFTPGVMQLPAIASTLAFLDPAKESNFNQQIPTDPEYETTLRLLYSKNAAHFASGQPSIRDIRLTNATVFGGIFDDNSAGISILRSSMGIAVGGEFADKNFPAPDPTLALPEQAKGPLYRWIDYDDTSNENIPLNDEGRPYSSRESEVSNLRDVARTFFEPPADFIEQYFPTRLVTDVAAASGGDRSGELENLRYDGPSQRPILLITAGDSGNNEADDEGPPTTAEPPNDKPLSRDAVLPGYNHLDVATAAWQQNDDRPEPSALELTNFALAATGAGGTLAVRDAGGCLRARGRVSARGIGALRLGATRAAVFRKLTRPHSSTRRVARWCVAGGGRVAAVFDRRGRVVLAATSARAYRYRGVGARSAARAIGKTGARRVAPGVFRRGRIVFRTHGKRVRFTAVARTGRLAVLRRHFRVAKLG